MPKLNTTVKSVRIDNDTLIALEGKLGGKSINAFMNECIEAYVSKKSGVNGGKPECNPVKSDTDLEEIRSVAQFYTLTTEELLKGICTGLMEGNLTIENGLVVGVPPIDLDRFTDRCHELNVDPQEAIDKFTRSMK